MLPTLEEKRDLILSKIEYKRKKKYLENSESFKSIKQIIDMVIEGEVLSLGQWNIFMSQLEFLFKKDFLKVIEDEKGSNLFYVDYSECHIKKDKLIWILLQSKKNII